jgi:hypothetical protein
MSPVGKNLLDLCVSIFQAPSRSWKLWRARRVSRAEIQRFFDQYVFGFIGGDIRREVESAKSGQPAGNFLCALGLLCYTEVLGGVRRRTLADGESRRNFEAFFREMGPDYQALLQKGLDVYKVFRCGMVHEYFVKGGATVAIVGAQAGITEDPGGRYYFVVEPYLEDFLAAAQRLRNDLLADRSATLPPELAGQI